MNLFQRLRARFETRRIQRDHEALRRWYAAYTRDRAEKGDASAQAWLDRHSDPNKEA